MYGSSTLSFSQPPPPRILPQNTLDMHPLLSALFLVLTAATVYVIRHRRYRSLKHLRGPQSPSWLLGKVTMPRNRGICRSNT